MLWIQYCGCFGPMPCRPRSGALDPAAGQLAQETPGSKETPGSGLVSCLSWNAPPKIHSRFRSNKRPFHAGYSHFSPVIRAPCPHSPPLTSRTSPALAMCSSGRKAPSSCSSRRPSAPCSSNVVFHWRTSPQMRRMIATARAREGVKE